MTSPQRIGTTADFPPGALKRVTAGADEVLVVNFQGQLYGYQPDCTHAYGSLEDGYMDNGVLHCPLHGACFSVRDGGIIGGPAIHGLRRYAITVDGADVFVVPWSPAA